MCFSSHERNKSNNIYVLDHGEIQGVTTIEPTSIGGSKTKGTTFYKGGIFKTNFTEPKKKFMLRLHYSFSNSYLFVNGVQQLKFKAKADQMQKNKLCVGNLSSDWTVTNQKKTVL